MALIWALFETNNKEYEVENYFKLFGMILLLFDAADMYSAKYFIKPFV